MPLIDGWSFAGYTIPGAPVHHIMVTNLVHKFATAPTTSHHAALLSPCSARPTSHPATQYCVLRRRPERATA
jgi:hypothetical protein